MLSFVALFALQNPGPLQEIEELRREIEFLRTVRSLKLTREQLGKIVSGLETAQKEVEEAAAAAKEDLAAMKKALEAQKEALEKGEATDPEQDRERGELHRAMGETMRAFHESTEGFCAELKEILDEKQWTSLVRMHRHDSARPLRHQVEQLLRHVEEGEGPEPGPGMLDRIGEELKRMSRHLGLSDTDLEAEVERITKILGEAVASGGGKSEETLRKIFDEGKLADAAKRMGPPPEEAGRQVARAFFQPKVLASLRKLMENAK